MLGEPLEIEQLLDMHPGPAIARPGIVGNGRARAPRSENHGSPAKLSRSGRRG